MSTKTPVETLFHAYTLLSQAEQKELKLMIYARDYKPETGTAAAPAPKRSRAKKPANPESSDV
jgi:hypothetical protein